MSAAHDHGPSITSEILRLCNRDTVPAPPPSSSGEEEAPRSSVKNLPSAAIRTSEPHLDTIPAPPPSAAETEEDDAGPPTLPSPPKLPTALEV